MINSKLKDKIVEYLDKVGAKYISIFGSYARDEATAESDVDIIVEFKDRKSLLELIKMERELAEILNIKVDLLTKKSISPYILDRIEKEIVVISE